MLDDDDGGNADDTGDKMTQISMTTKTIVVVTMVMRFLALSAPSAGRPLLRGPSVCKHKDKVQESHKILVLHREPSDVLVSIRDQRHVCSDSTQLGHTMIYRP